MGTARGFYFCCFNIYNVVKDFPCVRLNGGQNIRLVGICSHTNFNLSAVECLCVLMISRFTVNLVCCCNDLIQICCHPHLICISCWVFPLQCF